MIVDNLEFHVTSSGKAASTSMTGLSKSLKKVQQTATPANKALNNVVSSLKRIAMYRILRTIIKEITQAFAEGLKNAYKFSQTINSSISQTMDKLASLGLQMKNQLGASLGELLTTIQPILEYFIELITKLADTVSQVFAILGGRSTYHKALESTAKWVDDTKKGAKAAKDWKNQLLGFDVINRLEEPANSNKSKTDDTNIGNWELANVGKFEKLEELIAITKEWANNLDFEPLTQSWERLKEVVGSFVDLMWDGFLWVYKNILLPFGKWTIEDAAPRAINLLASAFNFLKVALERVSPWFKKIWDEGLKPLCKWISGKVLGIIDDLAGTFDSLSEKLKTADSLGEFLDSLDGKESIVLGVATAIAAVVIALSGFSFVNKLISGFNAVISALTSPVGIAIIAISALVAAGIWLYQNWDEIKEKIIEIWEILKAKLELFKIWVQGKVDVLIYVWDCLKQGWLNAGEALKADWENLKSKWQEVKNAIAAKVDELAVKWEVFKNLIGNKILEIKQFFEGLRMKWDYVKALIATKIDELRTKWEGFGTKFGEIKDNIVGFFLDMYNAVDEKVQGIIGFINSIEQAVNNAIQWLDNLMTHAGWDGLGSAGSITAGRESFAYGGGRANGGYVDSGELFLARENGMPELVGSIGGQTAVANNDQIVAAVSQGVASAVASVMNNSKRSDGGSVVLNINGREFCRAVYNDMQTVSNERGRRLVNA